MTLTESVAEQFSFHSGKDCITEKDMQKAAQTVKRWNENRVNAGLMPLCEHKQAEFLGEVFVDAEDEDL